MHFEWDEAKNRQNEKIHGLCFEDVCPVFSADDYLEEVQDVFGETRFIRTAAIDPGVVVVVFVERFADRVRIISARYATRHEIRLYQQELGR